MGLSTLNKALLTVAVSLAVVPLGQAGTWGAGKWGQMYWGSNPESTPTVAPTVSAQGDGTDISFTVTNLTTGEEMGWSVVTQFEVACSDRDPVVVSASNPRVTDLEPGTEYLCTIVAINDEGRGPEGTFTATTDPLGGLPVWLLYQATQQA